MTTLIERVVELVPNATPLWQGRPNVDSCVVEHLDVTLVATAVDADCHWLVCYPTTVWCESGDAEQAVISCDVASDEIPGLVAHLIDPPEGVDYHAWLHQHIQDLAADEHFGIRSTSEG